MGITWTYISAGAGAFLLSLLLTRVFMTLAKSLGLIDLPNARKVHDRPIPRSGGLAMAASCAAVMAVLFWFDTRLHGGTHGQHITLLALLGTSIAVLGIGWMDDLLNVPGKYKLAALAVAAGIFAASGQQISSLYLGGYSLNLGWASLPVTVLWLIAVPVSMNFLDGLDGLAGGVALLTAAVISIIALTLGAVHVAVIGVALMGCIAGFLVFNFHPAKVFMGDAGSLFLGFTLAALTVMETAYTGKSNIIFSVMITLSLPLLDTLLTFVRRGVLLRRSMFSAERGHIHHRMLDLGLHHRHAVILLYIASVGAATAGLTVMLPQRRIMLLAVGLQLCVLIGLFRATGSARARDTVDAIRRNRRIGRETQRHRATFEDLQVRFRRVKDFDGWWREVCAAAEMLDFIALELPLTSRHGEQRDMQWKTSREFASHDGLSAAVPIAHRRPGPALRARIEVAADGLLESAGERLALFTRLMTEFSLASLPDGGQGPARFSLMTAFKFGSRKSPARPPSARLNLQKYIGDMAFVDDKPVSELKVAIVHDFLYCYGGAERVLEQMVELFPNADLFSVFDFLPKDQREFLKNKPVTTTFIQKMPFAKKKHRAYLPLMPLAIEQLNVSSYDLIISSSYVVAKGVLTRPDQLHVCYCHSPARFAWDLQHQYLGSVGLVSGIKSAIARMILHYTRIWDVRSSVGVDVFLSNSMFVGRRIEKVYRRQSTPLYPPVDVERFTAHAEKEDFYLTASRLVPYKRTAVIVEAFNRMPERRLIVVGEGPELEKIRAMAGPNVRILGYQSADRLKLLMQRAKAFVFAAEEDFGIVAVEAQACGTPVIAYGRGGVTETVIQDKTGLFFLEQTPESIAAAVIEFEQRGPWDANEIRRNAESFSAEVFRSRLTDIIDREWAAFVERRRRNIAALRGETNLVFSPVIEVPLERDAIIDGDESVETIATKVG